MNLAPRTEPTFAPCERCGESTAAPATGRTICFECDRKDQAAVAAFDAFHRNTPESFQGWAAFGTKLLEVRTSVGARSRALKSTELARIVLTGPAGSGKTSLAIAMARDWAMAYARAPWFVTALRIGSARTREAGEGEIVSAILAPLLILDDLGSEREIPSNPIPEVIHERHARSRGTWVTTWMTLEQIKARYGDGIARRLFEGAAVIDCGQP